MVLALCGVWESDFTAKNLPIQRGESVGCLRVKQMEKLQLVNVKLANGLHYRKLRYHLHGKVQENKRRID